MQKILYIYMTISLFFSASTATAEEFKIIKGNGDVITKEILISEYIEMKIGGNIEKPVFNYSQRKNPSSVKLTIDSNLLPHLEIRVQRGCLTINTKGKERLLPTRLILDSQSARLDKAYIDGSFRFTFQTELNVKGLKLRAGGTANVYGDKPIMVEKNCKLEVSGVGKLKVANLQCSHLDAGVKDCGTLDLQGKAQTGKYKVEDNGEFNAYDFVMKNLNCWINGAGKVKTHVSERLEGNISEAGELKYKGFPRSDIRCTGAGKAKRIK